MNPYLLEMELQQRRQEMIEEARQRQQVALYNSQNRPKNTDHLLLAIADLLISLGEGLKRHYGKVSALHPNPNIK